MLKMNISFEEKKKIVRNYVLNKVNSKDENESSSIMYIIKRYLNEYKQNHDEEKFYNKIYDFILLEQENSLTIKKGEK